MSKRVLEISSEGCYLKLKLNQLIIQKGDKTLGSAPIEDLSAVVIDHPQTLITQALLSHLVQNNVMVISSDERHQPVGLFLPLDSHSTQTERYCAQAELLQSTRKNLWKQIVQGKLAVQAQVLKSTTGNDAGIAKLARKVRSGDPENIEAQAARRYWNRLFNNRQFRRDRHEEDQNRYLNYGYAIVRALVSRSICAAGLHPTIGLHHRNRYNSYCLADDLMEPYRPYVDLNVWEIVNEHGNKQEMSREIRQQLLNVIKWEIKMKDEKLTFQNAIQKTAQSLAKVVMGEHKILSLPQA